MVAKGVEKASQPRRGPSQTKQGLRTTFKALPARWRPRSRSFPPTARRKGGGNLARQTRFSRNSRRSRPLEMGHRLRKWAFLRSCPGGSWASFFFFHEAAPLARQRPGGPPLVNHAPWGRDLSPRDDVPLQRGEARLDVLWPSLFHVSHRDAITPVRTPYGTHPGISRGLSSVHIGPPWEAKKDKRTIERSRQGWAYVSRPMLPPCPR